MLLGDFAFEHLGALPFANRHLSLKNDIKLVANFSLSNNDFVRLKRSAPHRPTQIFQLLRVPKLA